MKPSTPKPLPPIESPSPTAKDHLCPAAFQSPTESLAFPPCPKIILRQIGSMENHCDDGKDEEEEDDNQSTQSFQDRASVTSSINPSNSTVSLKPVPKKKIKFNKSTLRKMKSKSNDPSQPQPLIHTLSEDVLNSKHGDNKDKGSEFYLTLQNRSSLKRHQLYH